MHGADKRPPQPPARLLVVTDQSMLAELVRLTLNHGRYVTRVARSGRDGRVQVQHWQPNLMLVDMEVDGGQVIDRLGYLPGGDARVPIIALTRRGDLRMKLAAFDRGVDDILTVPFSPEELLARALVVTRRTNRDAVAFTPVIRLGELEIDILNRRVHAGSSELTLTSLEQSLLYLLAANAGRLITREEIFDNLWGVDYAAESNVVDRHVRNLRAKLQDNWRQPRFIATVPGRGYRFLPTFDEGQAAVAAAPETSRDELSVRPAT